MIRSTAFALVKQWTATGIICRSNAEIYRYGLELLISTFINLVIMLGISTAFGHPFIVIPYLLAFIPLRLFAGGYHARNHLFCILLNTAAYFVSCLLAVCLEKTAAVFVTLLGNFTSFALIILFAPIPAKNRPLSVAEKSRNRTISLLLASTYSSVCIILYCLHLLGNTMSIMLFCGQMMATFLLFGGILMQLFSKV